MEKHTRFKGLKIGLMIAGSILAIALAFVLGGIEFFKFVFDLVLDNLF